VYHFKSILDFNVLLKTLLRYFCHRRHHFTCIYNNSQNMWALGGVHMCAHKSSASAHFIRVQKLKKRSLYFLKKFSDVYAFHIHPCVFFFILSKRIAFGFLLALRTAKRFCRFHFCRENKEYSLWHAQASSPLHTLQFVFAELCRTVNI